MNTFYNKARDQMYKEHRMRVMNAKSVLSSMRTKEPQQASEPTCFEDYLAQIVNNVRPSTFTFTKSPDNISMTQIPPIEYIRPQPPTSLRSKIEKNSKYSKNEKNSKNPKKYKSHGIFLEKKSQIKLFSHREVFMEDGQMHIRSRSQISDFIPHKIIQRYRDSADIGNDAYLRKLLRPKIFLEFYSSRTDKNLGHLEIQLYTEACPAIVLEFVRMCTRGERERLLITHIVEPISLECELALDGVDTLSDENFEHDTTAVDHGAGAGILTCPLRYVHGTRNKRLRFSITLRPLSALNGKRVAFGKAFGDTRLLQKVHQYGKSKKGNLQICVRTCGIEK